MKTSQAAEKKTQINETISTQTQGFLGQFGQVMSRVTGEVSLSQVGGKGRKGEREKKMEKFGFKKEKNIYFFVF